MRSLRQWLPKNRDASCLDLACGCGKMIYLLEQAGFCNTAGVICREELEEAGRYVRGSLAHADVLHLSTLESASLDLLTALNFLEHLSKARFRCSRNVVECFAPVVLLAIVPNAISPFGDSPGTGT